MARYIADCRFLASIYPGPLPVIRRNYGSSVNGEGAGATRSTAFELKPVPRGEDPFVLQIFDSFEEVMDIAGLSAMTGIPKRPRISKPVSVESIVADLLKHWTGGLSNVPNGAMPGIIELRPMKVELRKYSEDGTLPGPNRTELAQMTDQQTRYFEFLFAEGERLNDQKNWQEITDTMRLAADWLGFERVWSHRAIARDTYACPLCTKIISLAAVFCPECKQQLLTIPPAIAAIQSQAQPVRK
jgi:hypothetical protein